MDYVIIINNVMPIKSVTEPRTFTARINENGRIVIPALIREQMGLKTGEAVIMEVDDGVLRIESHRAHIRRIQKEFRQPDTPSRELAARQLTEDRQEDATQEMEQWLG